ncbi:hypothetical protein [Cyanobium sp. Lug-B]|uniref:hypothetical protein n=1 Tax=Cyanobium sp. Lug-B TaxID=2823716 RepID=UPI0020CE245B|nr:hypothetical protein [Cyanobium sp. Lug-B]MCP9797730.1 hypothetical protein [Cyanobium sp. Lug-B]
MERPSWAFTETAVIFKYYENSFKRVFILEGLDHHFDVLPLFTERDFCFITIPCHTTAWNFTFARKCLESQNPSLPLSNFVYLANTTQQINQATSNGFRALLFNHNALLDEKIYRIAYSSNRRYSIVLNTRPERDFKRPYLAKQVDNIAIIQGYNFRKDDFMDLNELNPKFINSHRLSVSDVVDVYNSAEVGGIFSAREGACYSSSEYLLCGLPVISTHSEGGRDIWYNQFNSIVCDATEVAVYEAVNEAKHKLQTGEFSRERIRAMHVCQQYVMRDNFCRLAASICEVSESDSIQMFYLHLAKTNKLQHKIKINQLPDYIHSMP